jgi:hypothetical protein
MAASAAPQTRRCGKRLRAPGWTVGHSENGQLWRAPARTWATWTPKPDPWAGNVGLYRKLRLASPIRHAPPIDAAAHEKSGDSGSTSESKDLNPYPDQRLRAFVSAGFLSFAELAIGFSQAPSCHLLMSGDAANRL